MTNCSSDAATTRLSSCDMMPLAHSQDHDDDCPPDEGAQCISSDDQVLLLPSDIIRVPFSEQNSNNEGTPAKLAQPFLDRTKATESVSSSSDSGSCPQDGIAATAMTKVDADTKAILGDKELSRDWTQATESVPSPSESGRLPQDGTVATAKVDADVEAILGDKEISYDWMRATEPVSASSYSCCFPHDGIEATATTKIDADTKAILDDKELSSLDLTRAMESVPSSSESGCFPQDGTAATTKVDTDTKATLGDKEISYDWMRATESAPSSSLFGCFQQDGTTASIKVDADVEATLGDKGLSRDWTLMTDSVPSPSDSGCFPQDGTAAMTNADTHVEAILGDKELSRDRTRTTDSVLSSSDSGCLPQDCTTAATKVDVDIGAVLADYVTSHIWSSIHRVMLRKKCPNGEGGHQTPKPVWRKKCTVKTAIALTGLLLSISAGFGAITAVTVLLSRNTSSGVNVGGPVDVPVDIDANVTTGNPEEADVDDSAGNQEGADVDDSVDNPEGGHVNETVESCVARETADEKWNAVAGGGQLTSGPMVGHTTTATAIIWAYASPNATVSVMYQRLGDCPSLPSTAVKMGKNQNTVQLTALNASAPYRYHVLVDGAKAGQMGSFTTSPSKQQEGNFRYMFGSCISMERDPHQTVWDEVLNHNPDFLVLNGDTVYADTTNYTELWSYHMSQRQIAPFANIIRQIPTYATWDDHDYGPNNSDGTLPGKNISLKAFQAVWANPSYGTPDLPGIFTTFEHGNVQFFIIDNRYHKMSDDMYAGEMQMQLLKAELKASNAVFKIIVHGGTIVRAGDESWFTRSKNERRELLDFLAENEITGVVFHGGDIHKNLFNPFPECPGNGPIDYEVYEIISSGLTNGGGRFTIVDIDTRQSLPTLAYQMIEAGALQERGILTVLDGSVSGQAPGVVRHEIVERSPNMTNLYPSCQVINASHASPVIGGIEES